ncbi:MAG TPA: hypothetical protein VFZ61_01950 [Polyangiales bacterium]
MAALVLLLAAPCLVLLLAAPHRAQASVNWLTVRGSCEADVDQLARRIELELAGQRPTALALVLELDAGAPVRGRLWLTEGTRVVGERRVEARSCEATLDLLTAIGALALSAWLPSEPPLQGAEGSKAAPQLEPPRVAEPHEPAVARVRLPREDTAARRDGDPAVRASQLERWRLLATGGVALEPGAPVGMLVTGGAALSWGPGELRLLGRYGLPATTEDIEAGARSVRRSDFGSAAVDYCYGLDRRRWLSLCAGLELLTRRERVVAESARQGREEATRRAPLLGPGAGLLLVLRQVVMQPQLELSALVPVWGAPPGFGFRASLGGGLPF